MRASNEWGYPVGYSHSLVGGLAFGSVSAGRAPPALSAPQAPDWTLSRPVEHAFRRGFALPAHQRRKNGAQPHPLRSVPVPAQYHRGKSAG